MCSETATTMLAELESEDIERLTDGALGDDLAEIRRTMDRVEFQFSRRLALFNAELGFWVWMLVTGVILFRAAGRPRQAAKTA